MLIYQVVEGDSWYSQCEVRPFCVWEDSQPLTFGNEPLPAALNLDSYAVGRAIGVNRNVGLVA